MTEKLFFGGVPVGPDVELLIAHFGLPAPGVIDHESVEAVLGLDRRKSRYRTVVGAWMKRLWDDYNVRMIGRRGGFVVLDGKGRLDQGERQRTKGARRLAQAVKEVVTTSLDELTTEEQKRRDLLLQTSLVALHAAKQAQHDYGIAMAKKPETLPKPIPPRG